MCDSFLWKEQEEEKKEEVMPPGRKENWEEGETGLRTRRWLCGLGECLGIT